MTSSRSQNIAGTGVPPLIGACVRPRPVAAARTSRSRNNISPHPELYVDRRLSTPHRTKEARAPRPRTRAPGFRAGGYARWAARCAPTRSSHARALLSLRSLRDSSRGREPKDSVRAVWRPPGALRRRARALSGAPNRIRIHLAHPAIPGARFVDTPKSCSSHREVLLTNAHFPAIETAMNHLKMEIL